MAKKETTFFLVYNPEGTRPRKYRHSNKEAADREARRLAELYIGKTFYVVKAVSGFTSKASVKKIKLKPGLYDEIPF